MLLHCQDSFSQSVVKTAQNEFVSFTHLMARKRGEKGEFRNIINILMNTHITLSLCVIFLFGRSCKSDERARVYFLTPSPPLNSALFARAPSMANNEEVWVKDLKNGLACLIFDMKRFTRSWFLSVFFALFSHLQRTQSFSRPQMSARKCFSFRIFPFFFFPPFPLFSLYSFIRHLSESFRLCSSHSPRYCVYIIKYFWEFQNF